MLLLVISDTHSVFDTFEKKKIRYQFDSKICHIKAIHIDMHKEGANGILLPDQKPLLHLQSKMDISKETQKKHDSCHVTEAMKSGRVR